MTLSFHCSPVGSQQSWVPVELARSRTQPDSWAAQAHARDGFIKRIAARGAFEEQERHGYSCYQAVAGGYSMEVRAAFATPSASPPGHPVTTGGSIAVFLHGPAGYEEISAQSVTATADTTSEIGGAALLVARAVATGIEAYVSAVAATGATTVEAAVTAGAGAAAAESAEVAGGVDLVLEGLAFIEVLGLVAVVLAVAVIVYELLVKTMTYQLTVFNLAPHEVSCAVSYVYNGLPLHNGRAVLPAVNAISDRLDPLGGGLGYDVAAKATFFVVNAVKALGLGLVLDVSGRGVVANVPAMGSNAFYIGPGGGPELWHRATSALPFAQPPARYSPSFAEYGLVLRNDQADGKTSWAGFSGFNYCSLLYVDA